MATTCYGFMTDSFIAAADDYLFLRNRGYPEKPSVKLVGDRYRLSGLQRKILFRGITSTENAQKRQTRLILNTEQLNGKTLLMDGYNVLLTFINYRDGKPLFVCNDGFLRDIGDYGEAIAGESFKTAARLVASFLKEFDAAWASVYLDEPVKGSMEHANYLKQEMEDSSINGEVIRVPSVDEELIKISKTKPEIILATSDSEIIDAVSSKIVDAAHHILKRHHNINTIKI
jgi:hypothetical protein